MDKKYIWNTKYFQALKMNNKLVLFLICTFVFTFLLFLIRLYFFPSLYILNGNIEEKYIENATPTLNAAKENTSQSGGSVKAFFDKKYVSENTISFEYIPANFSNLTQNYQDNLSIFLNRDYIIKMIEKMGVQFYEKKGEVRGNMKDGNIRLYGVLQMAKNEFLAVSIHEFSHYVDLYFLRKSLFKDLSDYFYELSWQSTTVLNPGAIQKDFVSGYAMTNKYEDFAESFTYYVLHNGDFLNKAASSQILLKKYNFFTKYVFKNYEFFDTNFSTSKNIKSYYRDITKIDFDMKKFLFFLKNGYNEPTL